MDAVSLRRLLSCLVLLALAIAPLGRMGVAQAKAMPHRPASAMASHCAGQPMPDGDKGGRMAVDCMIACAALAPAPAACFAPPPARPEAALATTPDSFLAGIRPEADPPPPRRS